MQVLGEKKLTWVKILQVLLPTLSSLFVISLTVLGVLLASGYSINFKRRTIVKTGVVNIVTRPSGAFIWLNKEPYGKTNKALPNIKVGRYFLELYKDGYFPFKLHIKVEHALATLIHTHLIKQGQLKQVQKITKQYFITEAGVVWLDWNDSQQLELNRNKGEKGNRLGILHITSISTNLLGNLKVSHDEFKFKLPFLGKLEKVEVLLNHNRSWLLLLVNEKKVFVAKLNSEIKFNEDDYLSSYFANGASLRFLNNNYVVILEPGKRAIAYNLRSQSKVLLYDGIVKGGEKGFCSDFLDDRALFVGKDKVTVVNQEGSLESSYNLTKLELNGEVPIYCKLVKFSKRPVVVLVYNDKFILLGPLFKDSTKQIYTVDTFKRARGFKIAKLYNDDEKNAEVVALVSNIQKPIKAVIPLIELDRLILVYSNKLQLFTFNKESPDIMSRIGFKDLYVGENISDAKISLGNDFILCKDNKKVLAVSLYGENVYQLEETVQKFYVDDIGKAVLFIKEVDKKPVLFVKEL